MGPDGNGLSPSRRNAVRRLLYRISETCPSDFDAGAPDDQGRTPAARGDWNTGHLQSIKQWHWKFLGMPLYPRGLPARLRKATAGLDRLHLVQAVATLVLVYNVMVLARLFLVPPEVPGQVQGEVVVTSALTAGGNNATSTPWVK